jgi:hypothetical protein
MLSSQDVSARLTQEELTCSKALKVSFFQKPHKKTTRKLRWLTSRRLSLEEPMRCRTYFGLDLKIISSIQIRSLLRNFLPTKIKRVKTTTMRK